MLVRAYEGKDLSGMIRIRSEVVTEGIAFPREGPLDGTAGAVSGI